MKELNEVKWKVFDIQEIFSDIQRGRRLKTEDHSVGFMPYVSSSAMNNGVDDFVSNTKGVRIFNNCLTIANSGSVGASFYHPYSFVASDHVTKLQSSGYNRYVYLFLATVTSRLSEKYSFNREINESRINREKVLIPVDAAGQPDYDFMEQYMKAIEKKLLTRYQSYLTQRKPNSLNSKKLNGGGKIEWKAFKMKDLMDIDACRFTGKGTSAGGLVPYVGATNRNNGVMDYLHVDSSYLNGGNCIVFICNGDGSIGLSVYRETSFVGSVDVKIGRSKHLNRYTGTFMTTVADTVRPHYSFGYKRTLPRLKNESLILPVTPAGQPDYSYMEAYMKDKETKLINRYMKYRLSAER